MSATIFLFEKIRSSGTSLVVQWLELSEPQCRGPGSVPGQELDPACCNLHPAQPNKQLFNLKNQTFW